MQKVDFVGDKMIEVGPRIPGKMGAIEKNQEFVCGPRPEDHTSGVVRSWEVEDLVYLQTRNSIYQIKRG